MIRKDKMKKSRIPRNGVRDFKNLVYEKISFIRIAHRCIRRLCVKPPFELDRCIAPAKLRIHPVFKPSFVSYNRQPAAVRINISCYSKRYA